MFCINCGTQLPDGANFCFKCGKQQGQDLPAQEQRSEICEIGWRQGGNIIEEIIGALGLRSNGQFVAYAIGPNGSYEAGKSQMFSVLGLPEPYKKTAKQMLDALIAQLSKDGWEPVETRNIHVWYGHKFRRTIKNKDTSK